MSDKRLGYVQWKDATVNKFLIVNHAIAHIRALLREYCPWKKIGVFPLTTSLDLWDFQYFELITQL